MGTYTGNKSDGFIGYASRLQLRKDMGGKLARPRWPA
jgi:hypothetical protein